MKINIKVLKEGNKFKRFLALEFVEEVYSNGNPCGKRGQYVITIDGVGRMGNLTQSITEAIETIFLEFEAQQKRRKV
jgi:nucleoside-triphosphatase THEP1